MPNPLFAVPLNMGTGTWIVTIVAGLSFVVMFGIASAFGDFQGLINTTLENDSIARENRQNKKIKRTEPSHCRFPRETFFFYVMPN